MSAMPDLGAAVLAGFADYLSKQKELADKALAQIDDASFFASVDRESNSIAVIVKHIAGNLRSRFTDFLTTDGEKPDRQRDTEFELGRVETRAELIAKWDRSWAILFDTLRSLSPGDLVRTVTVRGEQATVLQALLRALAHLAQHVGQIVLLAKHYAGGRWKTLSIPRAPARQDPGRDAEQQTASTSAHAVRNNEQASRYEMQTEAGLAVLEYMRDGKRLALVHTEVPRAVESRGLGAQLVKAALDDAMAQGLRIVPMCAFVRAYIARHPEYVTLVARQ
jgi:predicted GNAT family acetyltransferase